MKSTNLFLFITLFFHSIFAQNLVPNPSFENSLPLECLECQHSQEKFAATMNSWNGLPVGATICDCNYKRKAHETNYKYSEICPKNILPQDGCKMIEMNYVPVCLDWDHDTRGCGTNVASLLKEKLQMGKQYKVSFWVYIPSSKDPGFEKHIGFTLFPKKIRNPINALISQNQFQIDTIIHNQWYQVSWNIQPTCLLQFLVLGVFRGIDGPPVHNINRPWNNYYFIDNIAIEELNPIAGEPIEDVTFFCKPELVPGLSVKAEVKGASIYFESGESQISDLYGMELDSFAIRAKQNPKSTFSISGHTDNVGSGYIELSQSRIDAVLSYLETEHQIPSLRFIMLPKGISEQKNLNKTEANKQANRRVDIQQRDDKIEHVIYRNMLNYVFDNNTKQAYKALNIWMHLAPQKRKLLMLEDPRIDILKSGPRWADIQERVKKSYKEFTAGINLSYSLDSLWAADQKPRTLKYYIENLNAYIASMDSLQTRWDVNYMINDSEVEEMDQTNLIALNKLIGHDSWVKQSQVGERAAKGAFLIIQHSTDIDPLEFYLPRIESSCIEGEAPWNYYALMYDRIQVYQGLPQRYGTQNKVIGEKQELYPLEDSSKVNEWRNEIGLSPLQF